MRMEKAITAEQIGSTQKRRNNWIIAEKRSDVNLLNIFAPPPQKKIKNKNHDFIIFLKWHTKFMEGLFILKKNGVTMCYDFVITRLLTQKMDG